MKKMWMKLKIWIKLKWYRKWNKIVKSNCDIQLKHLYSLYSVIHFNNDIGRYYSDKDNRDEHYNIFSSLLKDGLISTANNLCIFDEDDGIPSDEYHKINPQIKFGDDPEPKTNRMEFSYSLTKDVQYSNPTEALYRSTRKRMRYYLTDKGIEYYKILLIMYWYKNHRFLIKMLVQNLLSVLPMIISFLSLIISMISGWYLIHEKCKIWFFGLK